MRVLHVSDTHLGFLAFDQVNDAGINAREQDVYDAFEYVIDQALELKPDVVIHSGDFFHRPSPSNRALTFALEQLKRLADLDIPFVVIAGNHETPKTVYTSPILKALRSLDSVHPFFGDRWECYELGDLAVHGVPHINDERQMLSELERLEPIEGKYNILMLHTSLGKRYLMEEYGEQVFPVQFELKLKEFQYIALGHWHDYQAVKLHPNAWYSGSTERFSDTEHDSEKGFILLDTDSGEHTFHPIPTRPWYKIQIDNCQDLQIEDILGKITAFAEKTEVNDAIISVLLHDIRLEQSLEISNHQLRDLLKGCFQLLPRRRIWSGDGENKTLSSEGFDKLDSLFYQYITEKYKDNKETGEALRKLAQKYFQQLN